MGKLFIYLYRKVWWETALQGKLIDDAFIDIKAKQVNLSIINLVFVNFKVKKGSRLESSYHENPASKYKVDLLFQCMKTDVGAAEASLSTPPAQSREDKVKLAKEGACILSCLKGDRHNQIVPLLQPIRTISLYLFICFY